MTAPTPPSPEELERLLARCPHDMQTVACAQCSPRGAIVCARRSPPRRPAGRPAPLVARFASTCEGCGARIRPSDTIARADDDDGWVGACCLEPGR
jgi:hypothetical protein